MNDTPKSRPPVRLFEGQLKAAEYARTIHVVEAPVGAVPQDYVEPEAYTHVVGRVVKQGDRLEVTAEDKTWWIEVLILSVSGLQVQAEILRKHEFEKQVAKEHDLYEPEWAGPTAKWRVTRKSDRSVMIDKLPSKSAAVAWIEEQVLPKAA